MRNTVAALAIALFSFVGGCWVNAQFDSVSEFSDVELVQELKARGWQSASTDQTEALYFLEGDDNHDGVIDEDESGWDCQTMGNGFCGL